MGSFKALRESRKALGICTVCGKRKPKPGRFMCRQCTQRYSALFQERFKKDPEGYRARWRKIRVPYNREYRKKKIENGLCTHCTVKRIPGRSLCQKHWNKYKRTCKKRMARRREIYAARRRSGMCGWCTKKALKGFSFCGRHRKYRLYQLEQMRIKLRIKRKKIGYSNGSR